MFVRLYLYLTMFQLILITPEQNHPDEVRIIEELCHKFNVSIHVRKPKYTVQDYRKYLLSFTSKQVMASFVLHDHHELVHEFSVKGIHLKERDRLRQIDPTLQDRIVSTSLHNIPDIIGLEDMYSYVFFSPIFESISKKSYGIDMSLEDLQRKVAEFKKRSSVALIGLGGISEETISTVKKSGFDGAALLGAVWTSKDPVRAFEGIYLKAL
jgi:thiamine-phosphate pyrophosphorylase